MKCLHGNKTERVEIRLDGFDKLYITALANIKGVSVGRFLRDLISDYKKEYRKTLTDEEYKELLDYMLILSQTKGC